MDTPETVTTTRAPAVLKIEWSPQGCFPHIFEQNCL